MQRQVKNANCAKDKMQEESVGQTEEENSLLNTFKARYKLNPKLAENLLIKQS